MTTTEDSTKIFQLKKSFKKIWKEKEIMELDADAKCRKRCALNLEVHNFCREK